MSSNLIITYNILISLQDVEPESGKKLIELLDNPPIEPPVRKQVEGYY